MNEQQLLARIREAGAMMRQAHRAEQEGDITAKAGCANFVTIYDKQIQEFLLSALRREEPNARFIAEEQDNDWTAREADVCYIIDPIDGTTNFIHDCRHSCLSLARLEHGQVVFGAVYDPYLDEMYHAVRGKGAYLNGQPIHVSERPLSLALAAFGTSPYERETFGDRTFALCRDLFSVCADVRRCGSAALDLARIAAGRYDLFFEFRLCPWDIAAGSLLITEAGGIISDMQGNTPDFSAPCSILAATPALYPVLLAQAKPYR